jgi:hypothetical protein
MSSRKFKSSRKSRFSMERLEDRQLMAGDVTAMLVGDTLMLTEAGGHAGAAQEVIVSQTANGMLRIEGVSQAKTRGGVAPPHVRETLINGQKFVEFAIPKNLEINLGDGSDRVNLRNLSFVNLKINTTDPNAAGASDGDRVTLFNVSAAEVDVRTGVGDDVVTIQSAVFGDGQAFDASDVRIDAGAPGASGASDRDTVTMLSSTVAGGTFITTGADADVVTIRDSIFGLVESDALKMETGAGADAIDLGTLNPQRIIGVLSRGNLEINAGATAEADADSVSMFRVMDELGAITVRLGGGDDRINMTGVSTVGVNKDITLFGGGGADTMTLTQVHAKNNLFADMGEGNDVLNLNSVTARLLFLDGGGDFDALNKSNASSPFLTQKGWERVNGLPVLTPAFAATAMVR